MLPQLARIRLEPANTLQSTRAQTNSPENSDIASTAAVNDAVFVATIKHTTKRRALLRS